jgi:thioredoxin reductase
MFCRAVHVTIGLRFPGNGNDRWRTGPATANLMDMNSQQTTPSEGFGPASATTGSPDSALTAATQPTSATGAAEDDLDGRHDVVVIGGGAAGLSAALVLSRALRRVLVVDAGHPRNAPATHMHGYLSRDGMPPAQLLVTGRDEVTGYGGQVVEATVTALVPDGPEGFWVLLGDGRRVRTRRLLVTTGLTDELPDIDGLTDRWARDVLHCPYCHGHEVHGQQLGVIGGTPGAVRYAHIVRQWTHDLVYFTPPNVLTRDERTELVARSVGIVEGDIDHLVIDDDHLVGVQMTDGTTVPRDALFVPPRFVPNHNLLRGLGCDVDENGWVRVNDTGRTSNPHVWAAGNVVDPRAQVITAAGAGSAAAIALNADLVDEDVRAAVHAFTPGNTA